MRNAAILASVMFCALVIQIRLETGMANQKKTNDKATGISLNKPFYQTDDPFIFSLFKTGDDKRNSNWLKSTVKPPEVGTADTAQNTVP